MLQAGGEPGKILVRAAQAVKTGLTQEIVGASVKHVEPRKHGEPDAVDRTLSSWSIEDGNPPIRVVWPARVVPATPSLGSCRRLRKGTRTHTPVATGSMRNRLRAQGIEALRGAYDGGRKRGLPPPLCFS